MSIIDDALPSGGTTLIQASAGTGKTYALAALTVGPGLHQRQGWQPALQALNISREMVGLEDLEAWWRRPS